MQVSQLRTRQVIIFTTVVVERVTMLFLAVFYLYAASIELSDSEVCEPPMLFTIGHLYLDINFLLDRVSD